MGVQKLNYSSCHIYSALLVAHLLKRFDRENTDEQPWNIGVISPYKAQASLTAKIVERLGLSERLVVHCGTVHGFQGDECDLIVFIANPNNWRFTGHENALLSKDYVYNVAISRARDHLWIVAPYSGGYHNDRLHRLRSLRAGSGRATTTLPAAELEGYLFGERDHLERYSHVTEHDFINVFGQTDMYYFIKTAFNAIDVQLNLPAQP